MRNATASLSAAANPFVLMLDPQSVLDRIAHSERLEGLERRVCRPLDRPQIGTVAADEGGAEAADAGDRADDQAAAPQDPA